MKHRFSISDLFFWQAVLAVVIGQYILCHDGIVCRGYPPMTEGEIYRMLASPLFVWIPAVFGSRINRMRGITVMSASSTLFLMMIQFNGSMVPSVGSRSGAIGVFFAHLGEIMIFGIFLWPIGFLCHYFYERVTGDLWRMIWMLPTENVSFGDTWRLAWGRKTPPIAT